MNRIERSVVTVACLAIAAMLGGGCSANRRVHNDGVTHVVVCWLKHPGDQAERQKLIDASKSFEEIPGVRSIAVGPAIASTRKAVDSSFDVALVIEFDDVAALKRYDEHPKHVKAVKDLLAPLADRVVIYDIENR